MRLGFFEPNDGMIPRYYGGEHPRLPCGRTGSITHRVERAFFAIPETESRDFIVTSGKMLFFDGERGRGRGAFRFFFFCYIEYSQKK